MSVDPFELIAKALDTLTSEGRIMLLAYLLTGALCGFARVLPKDPGSSLNVLYRKGALAALLLVPVSAYLLNVQVPVHVDEVVRFSTPIPGYVVWALAGVWGLGVLFFGYRLGRDLQATYAALRSLEVAHSKILSRAQHWQQRLNLKGEVRIVAGGAEHGWHVGWLLFKWRRPATVVLPAAALNWPTGVVDALLLTQLAQLQQGSWRWLAFARLIQVLYWPAPWVGGLVRGLAEHSELPGLRFAAAAYRDPEGWQRDVRNLSKRAATLGSVPLPTAGGLLRLPNSGQAWVPPRPQVQTVMVDDVPFEKKWAGSKRRKKDKERDPYEQAYWLIAVASLVVGVATTLTLKQRPPEFEPGFLHIKWQDRMVRRLFDDDEPVVEPETGEQSQEQ